MEGSLSPNSDVINFELMCRCGEDGITHSLKMDHFVLILRIFPCRRKATKGNAILLIQPGGRGLSNEAPQSGLLWFTLASFPMTRQLFIRYALYTDDLKLDTLALTAYGHQLTRPNASKHKPQPIELQYARISVKGFLQDGITTSKARDNCNI